MPMLLPPRKELTPNKARHDAHQMAMNKNLEQLLRCGECEKSPAEFDCKDCRESYCAPCHEAVHKKGQRKQHTEFRRLFVCQRCVAAAASVECGDCEGKRYCPKCHRRLHMGRGKLRRHKEIRQLAEVYPDDFADVAADKSQQQNRDEFNAFHIKVAALTAEDAAAAEVVSTEITASDEAKTADAFTDTETQSLLVGNAAIQEIVWGWRRLTRLMPNGALFELSKNGALKTDFGADGAAADDDGTRVDELLRFPRRANGIDEAGFNLALLGACRHNATLLKLIVSAEYRTRGFYSFHFFDAAAPAKQRHTAFNQKYPVAADDEATGPAALSVDLLKERFDAPMTQVIIDDIVPCAADGLPLFGLTENPTTEMWKVLLMKAYAKTAGRYAVLDGANPAAVLQRLTGGRILGETWGADVPHMADPARAAAFLWWRLRASKRAGHITLLWARPTDAASVTSTPPPEAMVQSNRTPPVEGDDGIAVDAASSTSFDDARFDGRTGDKPLSPESASEIPTAWGGAACAVASGERAACDEAAVAIMTGELQSHTAARLGMSAPRPPSGQSTASQAQSTAGRGWKLVKLNQLGGADGAGRFSYSHFSSGWTKELRDYFDFHSSDDDLTFATAEDVVAAFDAAVTCSCFPGSPWTPHFTVRKSESAAGAQAEAVQLLVVLRPGVTKLTVSEVDVFDFGRAADVTPSSALSLQLYERAGGLGTLRRPVLDLGDGELKPTALPAITIVNAALGRTTTVPDTFQIAGLSKVGEAGTADDNAVGAVYTLVVAPAYQRDALSVVMRFSDEEVLYVTVVAETSAA
jgi:hypothetical protein